MNQYYEDVEVFILLELEALHQVRRPAEEENKIFRKNQIR